MTHISCDQDLKFVHLMVYMYSMLTNLLKNLKSCISLDGQTLNPNIVVDGA